jgi:DNA-directed RNA polymerase specialized sigma24 family protein
MVAQAKTAESFRKAENQSLIGNAFDKLPAEQRTMLWLREVEGLSAVRTNGARLRGS